MPLRLTSSSAVLKKSSEANVLLAIAANVNENDRSLKPRMYFKAGFSSYRQRVAPPLLDLDQAQTAYQVAEGERCGAILQVRSYSLSSKHPFLYLKKQTAVALRSLTSQDQQIYFYISSDRRYSREVCSALEQMFCPSTTYAAWMDQMNVFRRTEPVIFYQSWWQRKVAPDEFYLTFETRQAKRRRSRSSSQCWAFLSVAQTLVYSMADPQLKWVKPLRNFQMAGRSKGIGRQQTYSSTILKKGSSRWLSLAMVHTIQAISLKLSLCSLAPIDDLISAKSLSLLAHRLMREAKANPSRRWACLPTILRQCFWALAGSARRACWRSATSRRESMSWWGGTNSKREASLERGLKRGLIMQNQQ